MCSSAEHLSCAIPVYLQTSVHLFYQTFLLCVHTCCMTNTNVRQLNVSILVCLFKHWGYTLACSNMAGKQHWLNRLPAARDRWWIPAPPGQAVCTAESHSTPQCEVDEDTLTKSQVVRDTWKKKRGISY